MATAKQAPPVLADEEFNKKWDQEGLYQSIKRLHDPRFGEITVVKNNTTNEILFIKEKNASSKQEASNDIRDLKSRIALNHPYLQKLVNYSTQIKKELCSTHYISRGFYEFPRSDTQKEHLERKRSNLGFSSSELTHLAYQVLDGLNHLHSRNITHGDIRPLNIGYYKANNQFQILDRLADPSPLERLQSANIVNKKELYIAPELFRKLEGSDKTLKYSAYKNDLYALGLTILHLGFGESVQDIYKPMGAFDQTRLNEHINAFNARYQVESPYLCTIVKTLLAANEADRPDSQQLLSNLIPYEQYKSQELQRPGQHAQVQAVYSYNAPVQQADRVLVNRAEGDFQQHTEQAKPQENYSDFHTTQEHTNVSYSYANPTTYTYAQAEPVTYTYVQPTPTTYVYAEPSNTYTTYNYAQPTTTYVHAEPSNFTYVQPNATFVNANVDPSRPERKSNTATYHPPIERKSFTQYVTGPDGSRTERRSYTHYVQHQEGQNQIIPDVVGAKPPVTTYVYSQPYTTYAPGQVVERKSYTRVSQNPTTTYVQGSYTYAQPNVVYGNYAHNEAADGQEVRYAEPTRTYYANESPQVYSTPHDGNRVIYANPDGQSFQQYCGNVEVRNVSYVPTQTETRIVRKKYIIEGDKVTEVDVNDQEHK